MVAAESSTPNAINRLLGGPFGAFMLKPWYDPVALQGVLRFFMPASRAWAAANVSGGDVQAFLAALGQPRSIGQGLINAIASTTQAQSAYQASETAWEDAVFNDARTRDVVALEDQRMTAADAWMRTRAGFLPSHLLNAFPAVKFEIESQGSVLQRHGARLSDAALAFPGVTDLQGFKVSSHHNVHGRNISWLRAPAAGPYAGDTMWARIEEPHELAKGAVIFCHGIMMEREHWASLYDQAEVFLDSEGGRLAVISPEGPGHGRRMIPGFYGGEQILAKGVGGILDYFAAHVVEVGRLIAWARQRYGGPVAIAGVSLGALTSQLVISAAKHWPAEARPDAALLLATNESMMDVTFNGSLAGGLGFAAALTKAGWTNADIDRWRPLVEPDLPATDPSRIVCVLGTTDTVTPYGGGERLVGRWNLPAENVFRWNGGHFAAAFSVLRDRAPIHKFKAALAQAGAA